VTHDAHSFRLHPLHAFRQASQTSLWQASHSNRHFEQTASPHCSQLPPHSLLPQNI
jgi:hypothetical protein